MEAKIVETIASNAPGILGVIIVVSYFLKAQKDMMTSFTAWQEGNQNVITGLANEVEKLKDVIIAHDSSMRETARILERGQKIKPKKR